MFFSAKSKSFFIDFSEHAVLVARTSEASAPLVVEDIIQCAPGDAEGLWSALKTLQPKKSASGYIHAICGISAQRRAIRKVVIEIKRLKEPEYLNEVVVQQLRIEPDQYTLAILDPATGLDYDILKPTQKEALICGLPTADIHAAQTGILSSGIYPETVELSSVAGLGAIIDYLEFAQIKTPVLLLEIGAETTNSYIVNYSGVEASRPIQQGLNAMIPVVQKELGLKDEISARKLFLSNTFDFTGMGAILIKRMIKELQSSIGFYEVKTGQSVLHVSCVVLPQNLIWLENAIAADLGVSVLKVDLPAWLQSKQITLADNMSVKAQDVRSISLFGLMIKKNTSNAVDPEKIQ